ncbi:MAG: sugar kinase [Desulfurococcaceae archaeon]
MKRFCIYGNPTIDLISIGKVKEEAAHGGGSFYSAIPLIERNLKVEVYAAYSHRLISHPISAYINVKQYSSTANIFKIEYLGSTRRIRALELAPSIYPWNMHEGQCYSIVNPVIGEVSISTLKGIKCGSELLAVDLQGFLRRVREGELVLDSTPEAMIALEVPDVIHADLEEFLALTLSSNLKDATEKISKRLKGVMVVTIRPNKSILISSSAVKSIDLPVDYVAENKTGAGDYFTSTYFYYYLLKGDEENAAYLAHEHTTTWLRKRAPR